MACMDNRGPFLDSGVGHSRWLLGEPPSDQYCPDSPRYVCHAHCQYLYPANTLVQDLFDIAGPAPIVTISDLMPADAIEGPVSAPVRAVSLVPSRGRARVSAAKEVEGRAAYAAREESRGSRLC